jgi:hypothetical protein
MERGEGRWVGTACVSVGAGQGRGTKGEAGGRRRGHRQVGPVCQQPREKEKKKEEKAGRYWIGRMGRWADWVGKGGEVLFYFFLFPFSNSFKIQTFSTQVHSKLFKTFQKI